MFSNTIKQLEERLDNLNTDLNYAEEKLEELLNSDETYDELEERAYELTKMIDAFGIVLEYFRNA